MKIQSTIVAIATCCSLVGCSFAPPKPWEKDLMAKPEMAMDGDPLEARFSKGVYTSRENSSGDGSAEGSGCGCN
jgi:hypothetical protein